MKKFLQSLKVLLAVFFVFLSANLSAQSSGIYESYAIVSANGGANAYYDMQAATANTDFQGANLGTFSNLQSLVIKGGENKTFKNGGCNINSSTFFYRVYPTASPSGSFINITENFNGDLGGGNQSWLGLSGSTNILSGLTAGNYTIEVYSTAGYDSCGTGTHFSSNLSANYKATFTVNPITVTSTTGTSSPIATYSTLAAAVTAINTAGVHTGTVVCSVPAGYTETAPAGGYSITASGTIGNTITFIKSGAGTNPTFTAPTPQTSGGALNDAIFKIIGGDYITIDGFTMLENASNTTTAAGTNNMTEWGVGLLKASNTDGAQNNIIQNCNITLNKTYTNTFGIYSNTRHTAIAISITADATSVAGTNSYNKFYSNTITNVNMGIALIGTSAAAYHDTGNDVGGTISTTGNTITNWGGAAAVSGYQSNTGTSYGIYMNHQDGDNISYNTLTSATLSGTAITTRGILKDYSGISPTGTFTSSITNNTITITDNFTSGTLECIRSQGMSALSTATININNNTILNTSVGGASSSTTIVGIVNSSIPGTLNMNDNVIRGTTSTATSGGFTAISNTGAVVNTININNNKIGNTSGSAITFSAATSGALLGISNSSGASTATLTISGNDFRGITHSSVGSSPHTYISNSASVLNEIISSNTFTNLNVNTTGSVTFVSNAVSVPATGSMNVNSNSIVTAFNKAGAGNSVTFYSSNASSVTGSVINFLNNNFSNITVTGLTSFVGISNTDGGSPTKTITGNTFTNISGGTGAINPMTVNYFGATSSVSSNTISNINWGTAITALTIGGSSTATSLIVDGNIINSITSTAGSVTGINNASVSAATNISNNKINTLISSNSGGIVTGITTSGTITNVFKNKIYDLSNSAATTTSPSIIGLTISAGSTNNVYNNVIGDLRALASNGTDIIRGISITSTTGSSTQNIYYNSIYLDGTSSGTNFGTSGIFHTYNNTGTTSALDMRNNNIVNNSTPKGTGLSVAFRRSAATNLNNYATTSNNNNFYAGTPGVSNLIFTDGTNFDQTLADFKTRVNARETASITENPPFLSIVGSNPTFLHIDPALSSTLDADAAPISGFSDDFDGDMRNVTTPDIGADEFTVTPVANDAGISAIPLGTICPGTNNVTVTLKNYGTATLTSATIDWKVNGVAQTAYNWTGSLATNATANVVVGTFPFVGAVSYTISATSSLPNGFADGKTANDTFTTAAFQTSLNGTYTVGSGGNFTTITAAVLAANTYGLCGPTVFSLTDATYSGSETFPITINSLTGSSSTNTLTIKPAAGISPTISGAAPTTNSLLKILNNFTTIDGSNSIGGTTKDLSITNTNTANSWIAAILSTGVTPVSNVILKNTNLTNGNQGSLGVIISDATIATAGYFNNITIQNNSIQKANYGLYINANSAIGNGSGLLITGNVFNGTGTNSVLNAIAVFGVDGSSTISSNNIYAANSLYNINSTGILLGAGVNNMTISGNTISGAVNTVSSSYVANGILLASGSTNISTSIYNNTISAISSLANFNNGSTGIEIQGATANVNIYNNKISDVKNNNTSAYGAGGIYLGSTSTTANTQIYNNMIWDVAGFGDASLSSDNGHGIYVNTGAGYKIYYNSVNMSTNQTAGISSALYVSSGISTANAIDMRNNIFANNQTANTRYAIYSAAAKTVFGNSDYNDYFSTGVLGFLGSNQVAITDWQTATSKDTNSLNVNPPFVSPTNLHLVGCTSLESGGTPIAGITTDIDADTRNITTPDIGADEFTGTVPLKIASVTPGSTCGTGTVSLSAVGATGTTQYLWYDAPSGGTLLATNAGTFTTPSISVTTTYYVAASNGSCIGDIRKAVVATVNPAPSAVSITPTSSPLTPATSCDLDYVKLDATGGIVSNVDAIKLTFENSLNDDVAGTWTTTNLSSGGTPANAAWTIRSNGYSATLGAFNSNDNSKFGLSNSDAQGSGGITNTSLISPAFSLAGYSSATLSFYHHYNFFSAPDVAKVDISTDGGSTWVATPLVNYSADQGTLTSFANVNINLSTYLGQTNLKIRFKYDAGYDYYWAVDNIKISGDKQQVTWSPTTGLYTNPALTTPYVSGSAITVYASPEIATTYTATATLGGCAKIATYDVPLTDKKSFTGNVNNNWSVAGNWLRGSVPTIAKCVTIPNGKTAVIDIATAVAKSVTIADGGKLTISPNQTLVIDNEITNNNVVGNVDFVKVESDGNLIQINEDVTINTGNITAKRDISLSAGRAQYNYLISPVENQFLTGIYNDGSNPVNVPTILYHSEANNRFYNSTGAYIKGRGLAVKEPLEGTAPTGFGSGTGTMNTAFRGKPTNGSFPYTIVNSNIADTNRGYNLIGNPYPSNIDLLTFYTLNGGVGGNLDSSFYFWDNKANSQTSQAGNLYTGAAYAMINMLSLGTAVPATGDPGSAGSKVATQYVKTGQAFMAKSKVPSTSITFNNTIRTKMGTIGFFGKNDGSELPVNRYWLKMISPANIASTIATVYFPAGNNNFTQDDTRSLLGSDAVYSIVENEKVAINGRTDFADTDIIPLGSNHFATGNYTISLGTKEGIFANGQNIYLKDKQTGILTNLSAGNYTFTATAGETTGRFEIVYLPEGVLATDGNLKESLVVYRDGSDFVVKAQSKKITNIEVFDGAGRLILALHPNNLKAVIPAEKIVNGVYVLKINQNGQITSKKIIR